MNQKQNQKYGYIYQTTCNITGKRYIGQSTQLNKINTYYGSGIYLTRSLKKHGKENHFKRILGFAANQEQLDEMEVAAIEFGKPEMNIALGGKGAGVMSDETKKKLSEVRKGNTPWNKGMTCSDLMKEQISKTLKGYKHTDETRKKMSEGQKKRKPISDETRLKLSKSNTGKKHSDETRKKISEAARNISPETRKKMSESKKNMSEETKKKISEAAKKQWERQKNRR